jgi:hypothetical protein
MINFTIEGSSLQIKNGDTILLTTPTVYVGLYTLALYQDEPRIYLYNLAQGTNLSIFEARLDLCSDGGTPFTIDSIIAFAEANFGTFYVSVPPATGGATSALQQVGNASLASIDGKTPALQGGKVPVIDALGAREVTLQEINTRDSDLDYTGSITPSTPFVIDVEEKGTLSFTTSGTWVGTIIVEASLDGVDWRPTTYVALSSGNASSSFSANTSGQINCVGLDFIRFRSNTISSGSATIVAMSSRLVSNVMLDNSLPSGSNNIGSINNITGTVPLPTGASTSDFQIAGNNILGSIATRLNNTTQSTVALYTALTDSTNSSVFDKNDVLSCTTFWSNNYVAIDFHDTIWQNITQGFNIDAPNQDDIILQGTEKDTPFSLTINDGDNVILNVANIASLSAYTPDDITIEGSVDGTLWQTLPVLHGFQYYTYGVLLNNENSTVDTSSMNFVKLSNTSGSTVTVDGFLSMLAVNPNGGATADYQSAQLTTLDNLYGIENDTYRAFTIPSGDVYNTPLDNVATVSLFVTGLTTSGGEVEVMGSIDNVNFFTLAGVIGFSTERKINQDTPAVWVFNTQDIRYLKITNNNSSTAQIELKTSRMSSTALIESLQSIGNSSTKSIVENQANGTQRTKLTDGTNNVSVLDGGGGYKGLVVSQGANVFIASAGNTSVVQLAGGASFTGTIDSCFSQPATQINIQSDKDMTLVVNQYIDALGTRKSDTFTYSILANQGFSMCLPLAGNYINVVVTNSAGASTTTFSIDTTFGMMQSVDTYGNQPITIGTQTYGVTNSVYVGGTSQVQVTPTVTSASAYTAGNVVGGLLTFPNIVNATVKSGVLESISIAVKSLQTTSFKLYIFSGLPSTTFTNKTAPAIVVGDASKLLDVYSFTTPDNGLGNNVTLYYSDAINRSLVLDSSSMYGVLVCLGTPTFTTTTDVIVTASILRD